MEIRKASRRISPSAKASRRSWKLRGVSSSRTTVTTASVNAVVVTPDGKRVVSGSAWGNALKVWDLERGEELRTLTGHVGLNSV